VGTELHSVDPRRFPAPFLSQEEEADSMTFFFAPVLAAALLSQFQGGAFEGTVVDEHGKPVGDIEVVFHVSAPWGSRVGPVVVRTKSDADGRFRLTTPSLRGDDIRRAYSTGTHT
jgi:hypothetical protein